MNVLVACEFSGRVRDSFAALGHYAVSCDFLESEGDPEGLHYQGDVRNLLDGKWDLMLAFPPCTHLAASGARWWKEKEAEQKEALEFVELLLNAPIPKICLENPVGKIGTAIRKPDQTFQPYHFGHPESKRTCLWLKGLPKLEHTNVVKGRTQRSWLMPDSKNRGKNRSRTYVGVAEAMANQWSEL